MAIDWKPIAEKMGYKDGKAVVTDLYGNKKLSSEVVAAKIRDETREYITGRTIILYARMWGLEIRPRGGANNVSPYREKLSDLEGKTETMTAKEVAAELEVSLTWAYRILKEGGFPYKRLKRIK